MVKIAVVFDSATGNTAELADVVASGAEEAGAENRVCASFGPLTTVRAGPTCSWRSFPISSGLTPSPSGPRPLRAGLGGAQGVPGPGGPLWQRGVLITRPSRRSPAPIRSTA